MAVTHADLAPSRGSTELGSKTGLVLVITTIICGLLCFIFCLIAEVSRSQINWVTVGNTENNGKRIIECVYSGNGMTPLLFSSSAFLVLAVSIVVEHIYLSIAMDKYITPTTPTQDPPISAISKPLTLQLGFFFLSTWICFTIGEILLLIGGVFSAAGVFNLAAVFLVAGLYITTLQMQRVCKEREIDRRQEATTIAGLYYASPRTVSPNRTTAVARNQNFVTDAQYENRVLNKELV